jgi:hypothetical protein
VSFVTTKPLGVLDLDWGTTDPLRAMTLGKSLAARGYVFWRKEQFEWIVISPTQNGHHETVHRKYPSSHVTPWWNLLVCTCQNGTNPEGPCVHKCAVHTHATSASEYRYYTEG